LHHARAGLPEQNAWSRRRGTCVPASSFWRGCGLTGAENYVKTRLLRGARGQRGADEKEIKKAYRRVAMKYHPDRNSDDPQSEDKFKEASEAYEVLTDGEKRAAYDQFGHAGVEGQMGGGGFGGGSFSDIFGDVFGDIFGGGGGRGRGGPSAARTCATPWIFPSRTRCAAPR
jgi:hypothetical protein